MFRHLQRKYRLLRIKSQILIFNLSIVLIVIVLAFLAFYVQTYLVERISYTSSKAIMEFEDRHQVSNIAQYVHKSIEYKHKAVIHQLKSVATFIKFFEQYSTQITTKFQTSLCVTAEELAFDLKIKSAPRFCYQANAMSNSNLLFNDDNVQYIHNAVSFLDNYSLEIDTDQTEGLQIAAKSNTKYFVQFPFTKLFLTYDITERPWYTNHVTSFANNPNKKLIFKTIFSYFTAGQLQIAVTYSLLSQNNQSLLGIAKQSLKITDRLVPSVAYNLMMLDEQGVVVLYQIEQQINTNNTFFIYDQLYTGFNITDWQKISETSNNISANSNIILIQKHCNQSINMNVLRLDSNNFTLIIYSNITTMNIFQSMFGQLIDQETLQWMFSAVVEFSIELSAIIIQVVVISFIFHPLYILTSIVRYHSLSLGNNVNSEIFKMANQVQGTDSMLHLQDLLAVSQEKKCSRCIQQENLPYNTLEQNLDSRKIREKLKFLYNKRAISPSKFYQVLGISNY